MKMGDFKGGYIRDGRYIRVSKVNPEDFKRPDAAMFKASDQDRQRKDFAREIIQPFDFSGKPNEDFIEAFPQESKEYGFIPSDEQIKKEG